MENVLKDQNHNLKGIQVMTKPNGPSCNLGCDYCFYLEKENIFDYKSGCQMPEYILKVFIDKYINAQPSPVVEFIWQGGEPTLRGLDFFKRVVELQKPYTRQKKIFNSLQTNGSLLNDKWCYFLKKHNFLVGLSLDGPEEIHNRYRKDLLGKGSFDKVMNGLRLLKKHGVEYNVMASVAKDTTANALEVYSFFKNQGVKFIQFVPIVERMANQDQSQQGFLLAGPSSLNQEENNQQVVDWCVEPEAYGDFLIAVFDQWVRNDVGAITVMNFEWALNAWVGNPSPVCVHANQCGRSVVLEHNGDVFSCDHYVYPDYKLGNIIDDDLLLMVEKSMSKGFGTNKETMLPISCKKCDVLKACQGGCPKHRFIKSHYGEPGLHYLCKGYKKFFFYIRKYLKVMTQLMENGYPASHVMEAIKGPLVLGLEKKGGSNA